MVFDGLDGHTGNLFGREYCGVFLAGCEDVGLCITGAYVGDVQSHAVHSCVLCECAQVGGLQPLGGRVGRCQAHTFGARNGGYGSDVARSAVAAEPMVGVVDDGDEPHRVYLCDVSLLALLQCGVFETSAGNVE